MVKVAGQKFGGASPKAGKIKSYQKILLCEERLKCSDSDSATDLDPYRTRS